MDQQEYNKRINARERVISTFSKIKSAYTESIKRKLETAVMLSNLHREPVMVQYADRDNNFVEKEVYIIAATQQYAMLQGGETIPISRISKVLV